MTAIDNKKIKTYWVQELRLSDKDYSSDFTRVEVVKLSDLKKEMEGLKLNDDFHEYYKEEILPKDDHLVRIIDEIVKRLGL